MLNEEDRNLEETDRACDRGSDDPFRRAGGVCRRADGLGCNVAVLRVLRPVLQHVIQHRPEVLQEFPRALRGTV